MQIFDHVALDKAEVRITNDGYLVAMPRVARTGIQDYAGFEVGKPDMAIVRVYRPEDEVFNKDSMQTFAYRPITDDHPKVPVSASNWKDFAVGQSGGEVARDGDFMRVPMVVMDDATIKKYRGGKVELSVGYATDLKWETGTTKDGQTYDAIQTNIRVNHIAVVDEARGGPKLRIGDRSVPHAVIKVDTDDEGDTNMAEIKTATHVVDGIAVEMTDIAASIVTRHVKSLGDTIANLQAKVVKDAEMTAEEKKALEEKLAKQEADTKVKTDALQAQVDALTKQVADAALTPAKLDQLVTDRAVAFGKAKHVLGDKLVTVGKSVEEVMKQVVDAKMGEVAKAYTADQVKISFDTLTAGIKLDASTAAADTARAFSLPNGSTTTLDGAYAKRDLDLSNRWKGAKAN